MKYYVLEFDDVCDPEVEATIPIEYEGVSLNLGMKLNDLPSISLKIKGDFIPDCIPNHRRYIYFSQRLLNIIVSSGFTSYEAFDIAINRSFEHGYKLINFLEIVDCIDRSNSELVIDEEEEDEDMNIRDIAKLVLDETMINGQLIFRLGGFETLLLFREDLAQEIVNAKCTGLHFIDAKGYMV